MPIDTLDKEIAVDSLDDRSIARLITITGVNLTVAAGIVAAIGDVHRFSSPQKLVSYFGLNPRVRQSGLGAAHHGRISKAGRSHARAMLVEAAWAAAKTPGPLHAFFVRIRAKRGHQVAAVALARKLTVLCWHLLTKQTDYRWARPALVANKRRAMELAAGQPQKKGNKPGPAYAYNVKALRDQEMEIARCVAFEIVDDHRINPAYGNWPGVINPEFEWETGIVGDAEAARDGGQSALGINDGRPNIGAELRAVDGG